MTEDSTAASARPPVDCAHPLPAQVRDGLALFNAGEFFEQHEVLEEAWRAEVAQIRDLYRGILQIGVGFYHLGRGNARGARNLLTYGIDRLAPFDPSCMGVDVAALRAAAGACRAEIERLGPARLHEFEAVMIPKVRLISGEAP